MKRMSLFGTFIAMLCISLPVCAGENEADTIDFHLQLTKGERYRCTRTHTFFQYMWQGMTETESRGTNTSEKLFEVLDVDAEGVATLKVTTHHATMQIEEPSGTSKYDSKATPLDEAPWFAVPTAATIGRSYTVTVTPERTVLEVTGSDALRQAARDVLPNVETFYDFVAEAIENELSDDALKEEIEMILLIDLAREIPVAVGDSWDVKQPRPGGFVINGTYQLTARRDDHATITYSSTIETDPEAEAIKEEYGSFQINVTGAGEGLITVDETTGMILNSRIEMTTEGEYVVRQSPNSKGTSTPVTSEVSFSVTIERERVEKAVATDSQ